ncbi:MAG TPA: LysR family transcriptional regulator [Thiobacillus sp.]|nr:MAG: LysR family transcriptional regulator [Hydrogenophilales bacterium 28-61-11]OYZ58270.1 MAG: LysR family transcriptional regulator [Hydrogenophilales bacterium 16-61-112]OZA47641.1 MAG: LysR family transcriptional regulator [Hydrogenophilales bacterium 17-61-76]HQT32276.1 LysR family transcriptional regulator [Thiobacillus sp.]HQT71760.1 LysR family transcriptional regulator [Thiobacillus sp.]
MDKLKAMQTVVSIADEGSLTAAAAALDSSPPAVVRTLATLEAYLGIRLFNRTTRRISLTEEGRHYIENCRQLLTAIKDAESALTTDAVEPSGQLTITAPVLFGQMYVAPAVTRFVQKHDKVRVNLLLLDRVANLLEEHIDVGIRIGPLEDSTLVAQPLGSVRRMVVASPDYMSRHAVPQHPRDLLKANCVRFSGGAGPWWTFHESGKPFTVPVTGNLEFNHVAPAAEACLAGLGFGMFISYQVAHHIAQNHLQVVLESFEPPPRPIHVVYPHARLLPARTKVFIEWIKQELKDLHSQPSLQTSHPR